MLSTQDRILRSARQCFEQAGLRQTRMEDIAIHAGLSRQTVYKYFTSKRDIIDHLALCEMISINQQLRQKLRPTDAFADRLTEIIVVSVEIALPNPYIRAMLEDIDQLAGYPARNPRLYEWQVDQWSRLLSAAHIQGELAADIDIPSAVRWITMCQLLLIITYPKLGARNVPIRPFVQRFMVNTLLHRNDPAWVQEKDIARENAKLRDLVATQALEIFQLREQLAAA